MGKIPCAGQTIPSSVVGDAAVPQVQVISLAVVEAVVVALAVAVVAARRKGAGQRSFSSGKPHCNPNGSLD